MEKLFETGNRCYIKKNMLELMVASKSSVFVDKAPHRTRDKVGNRPPKWDFVVLGLHGDQNEPVVQVIYSLNQMWFWSQRFPTFLET